MPKTNVLIIFGRPRDPRAVGEVVNLSDVQAIEKRAVDCPIRQIAADVRPHGYTMAAKVNGAHAVHVF